MSCHCQRHLPTIVSLARIIFVQFKDPLWLTHQSSRRMKSNDWTHSVAKLFQNRKQKLNRSATNFFLHHSIFRSKVEQFIILFFSSFLGTNLSWSLCTLHMTESTQIFALILNNNDANNTNISLFLYAISMAFKATWKIWNMWLPNLKMIYITIKAHKLVGSDGHSVTAIKLNYKRERSLRGNCGQGHH